MLPGRPYAHGQGAGGGGVGGGGSGAGELGPAAAVPAAAAAAPSATTLAAAGGGGGSEGGGGDGGGGGPAGGPTAAAGRTPPTPLPAGFPVGDPSEVDDYAVRSPIVQMIGVGDCVARLIKLSEERRRLAQVSPTVPIAWWRRFVAEFFAPSALLLYDALSSSAAPGGAAGSGASQPAGGGGGAAGGSGNGGAGGDGSGGPGLGGAATGASVPGAPPVRSLSLQLRAEGYARLLRARFSGVGGIKDERLLLENPCEFLLQSGVIVVDCPRAIFLSEYASSRVHSEGHLRVSFAARDRKIVCWEFSSRSHVELLDRAALTPGAPLPPSAVCAFGHSPALTRLMLTSEAVLKLRRRMVASITALRAAGRLNPAALLDGATRGGDRPPPSEGSHSLHTRWQKGWRWQHGGAPSVFPLPGLPRFPSASDGGNTFGGPRVWRS